ncbi:MAG: DUF1549 domain-containing protein [Pirellulaceae bacterium]|nr:DUF1549 domain-containing protein [Pirellulaceae bacterium]
MTPDRDEYHLLDACLDEVLAGRTPPDLTARILQAHAARGMSIPSNRPIPLGPPPTPQLTPVNGALQAAPANGQPVVQRVARGRRSSTWQTVAIALGSLCLVALVGVLIVNSSRQPPLVKNPPGKTPAVSPPGPTVVDRDRVPSPVPRDVPAVDPVPAPAPPVVAPSVPPLDPTRLAGNPPAVAPLPPMPVPVPQPKYLDPAPSGEVISFVNASLAQVWVENEVTPSPLATDAEWCRRLFVRVIGRIPTADELKSFTTDRAADRRQKLVDKLLSDDNYVEEYARHWATTWSNILIGRTGGEMDANRAGLEQYLRQSFARNKPYDQLVRELITATGSSRPGSDQYNGAVNFLLAGYQPDATLATARVSRVFLGHQLQCAQCHAHPSHGWSQEQFWSLNAFFRQMNAEKTGSEVRLTNVDFGGEGKNSTEGEVFFETPTGLLKSAFPVFVDGTKIPTSGQLVQVDRRAELARLVLASPQMPKALVNRV